MLYIASYIRHILGLVLLLALDILFMQGAMAQYAHELLKVQVTDSMFLHDTHPVVFVVARTELTAEERQWIDTTLIPDLEAIGPGAILIGRAAASPEGPLTFNRYLARGRRDAVIDYCRLRGFDASRIQFDIVDEEYDLLLQMMKENGDADYERVRRIVQRGGKNIVAIKAELRSDYALWTRLKQEYFPPLRAVRIMAFDYESMFKPTFMTAGPIVSPFQYENLSEPIGTELESAFVVPQEDLPALVAPRRVAQYRRELLAVKTNLLEWGAYVPQYGWCPMPNVELEYYPRHGHWTFGGTFDCPWWIGNTTNHKYFELRNYQLYSRYYLRNSDRSYLDQQHTQPSGEAAFRGFYAEAYAQAFLYQIGFSAKKGWIGEGYGAGLGAGYVLPISRDGHWRLDFGLQVGFFRTQYDPFVYGKPVYHGGEIDGLYYYNTPLYRKDFVKRQHLYTWLGPTRVGISISYDLLYRQKDSKRPSFRSREKGVAP